MVLTRRDELTCQVRDVLDRVGDKWTLNVIYELREGSRRFTDLKRAIDGISQRMLTVTLRSLERDGLVERTVYATVPPRVDYRLTTLGQTLLKSAWELIDWATTHAVEIDSARKRFDRRPAAAQPPLA
jgi:DNA-binding HxlR family transcriptional regulator